MQRGENSAPPPIGGTRTHGLQADATHSAYDRVSNTSLVWIIPRRMDWVGSSL